MEIFSNNREQQKAKIQTRKIHFFCIQICTPKHERAENPFSENHALSPPHFRKFDCCRHIPKIIPKTSLLTDTTRLTWEIRRGGGGGGAPGKAGRISTYVASANSVRRTHEGHNARVWQHEQSTRPDQRRADQGGSATARGTSAVGGGKRSSSNPFTSNRKSLRSSNHKSLRGGGETQRQHQYWQLAAADRRDFFVSECKVKYSVAAIIIFCGSRRQWSCLQHS